MKWDSVSAYVHMSRDIPSPYMRLYAFWMDDPHQLPTHLIDGPFLNQKTYKYIRISYLLKYKHLKK